MIKVFKDKKLKFPNQNKKEFTRGQISELSNAVSNLSNSYSSDYDYDKGYRNAIIEAVREIDRLLHDGSNFQPPSYSPFEDCLAKGERYFCMFSVNNPSQIAKRVKVIKSKGRG